MKGRTIRINDKDWEEVEKRSKKNPSKFIRDCIKKEIDSEKIIDANCCFNCEEWAQSKPLDEYPENILSGVCKIKEGFTKSSQFCKRFEWRLED